MCIPLRDTYPELVKAQLTQVGREIELRARRRARRARVAAVLRRGYAPGEEVRGSS